MPVYTLTLTELRARCRTAADMTGSEFVSDTELDRLINSRIRDYTHLVGELEAEEHGLETHSPSAVTSAADLSAVSPAVYKILHVMRTSGQGASASEPIRVPRLPSLDRGRVIANTDSLDLLIEYIGAAPTLALTTDEWTFCGDAEDYLVGYVAGKMLSKEESDPSTWFGIAADAEKRLRSTLKRVQYDGGVFPDDRLSNEVGLYWRLNGNSLELFRDSNRDTYWP